MQASIVLASEVSMPRGASIAVAALLTTLTSPASVAQTMSLPGTFAVNGAGGATQTVPISVPPGTAGMTPSLSLSYNSQSGNGLLGVGWSLDGLPSIGRCPRTWAQDGFPGGINFDANDRFCLDGQRLVAISGTYGADGTEYRTEIDSFSRIFSRGTAGTGPSWFEVHTKAGQVMEFGHTVDSRILAVGKATARSWAVNKVSDTKSNYFTVTYVNDTTNGQAYPSRVDYTGNSAASVATFNSVQFVYAARPDISPQYQAGSLSQTTVRLTDVKTFAGAALVADYRLAYQQSVATNRSRIASVTVCDGSGNCLPGTNLTWQDMSTAGTFTLQYTSLTTTFGSPPSASWSLVTGDFNGDGISDYAMVGSTNRYVYLGNRDSTFTLQYSTFANTFGSPPHASWSVITGDFNGDGKTDYAMVGSGNRYVYLSNGDGNFTLQYSAFANSFGSPPSATWAVITGDFDGDGKTDYAMVGSGNRYVYLSNGDGNFTLQYSAFANSFGSPPSATWAVITGDFDGDGKTDYAMVGSGNRYVYLSNGDGNFTLQYSAFANSFGSPPTASWSLVTGDFNGDGKSDYAMVGSTNRYVYLSNGDGNFTLQYSTFANTFGSPPTASWAVFPGDFNGDGKTDYAVMGNSNRYVYLSNGDGNFTLQYSTFANSFGSPPNLSWALIGGDFNGDGLSDYAMVGSTNRYAYIANGAMPDLVTSFTNGLGVTTTISYTPATNTSVVTKGTGTSYPSLDLAGPLYVVSRVDTANGVGGNYSVSYAYSGGRLDVRGRGFLGFAQTATTDLQTNIVETTTYSQSFPYVGMMGTSKKTLGSLTLNQTTNSFQFSNASGASTVSAPSVTSAPYRVSLSQSVAQSNDLDGTALPTVTTSSQYDSYNNVTQVVVSTPDGFSKTTTNTYTNDTTNWYLGRLTRASVTSVAP